MGNHYNAAKKATKRSIQHSSATPSADGVTSVRVCAVPTLRVTLMHASLDTARDVYRNATRDSMTFMRYTENAMEKSEAMRDHAARVMEVRTRFPMHVHSLIRQSAHNWSFGPSQLGKYGFRTNILCTPRRGLECPTSSTALLYRLCCAASTHCYDVH